MIKAEIPQLIQTPSSSASQPGTVMVTGCWQVHAFAEGHVMRNVGRALSGISQQLSQQPDLRWDLSQAEALDHIGAQLLWNGWDKKRPDQLILLPTQEAFFQRLEQANELAIPKLRKSRLTPVMQLGKKMLNFISHLSGFTALLGQLVLDVGHVIRHPGRLPRKEISANIFQMGFNALGITALVGILIGIVLSYLSAQQLRTFGGDIYIINILGVSIVRELGPLLAAILVAGRSGSAITAQLGVMRVTEELDAMLVMGIPHGLRLILPKVIALAIAMPLLVIWTDAMALIGGMFSANLILDMSPRFFIEKLPDVVAISNFYIGLIKGVTFGSVIALVSCHFGLRIKPNTESLGQGTTTSVVSAITVVIILDAVFAILFKNVGYA